MDDYLEYYDELVNYVRRLSCSLNDYEDVAQEAMLRCSQHRSPHLKESLFCVAKNIVINDFHQQQLVQKVDVIIEEVAEFEFQPESEPINVDAMLDRLDRVDRLILTVAIMEGKGYKEAAKKAGITYVAARHHGSRAITKLREELQLAV